MAESAPGITGITGSQTEGQSDKGKSIIPPMLYRGGGSGDNPEGQKPEEQNKSPEEVYGDAVARLKLLNKDHSEEADTWLTDWKKLHGKNVTDDELIAHLSILREKIDTTKSKNEKKQMERIVRVAEREFIKRAALGGKEKYTKVEEDERTVIQQRADTERAERERIAAEAVAKENQRIAAAAEAEKQAAIQMKEKQRIEDLERNERVKIEKMTGIRNKKPEMRTREDALDMLCQGAKVDLDTTPAGDQKRWKDEVIPLISNSDAGYRIVVDALQHGISIIESLPDDIGDAMVGRLWGEESKENYDTWVRLNRIDQEKVREEDKKKYVVKAPAAAQPRVTVEQEKKIKSYETRKKLRKVRNGCAVAAASIIGALFLGGGIYEGVATKGFKEPIRIPFIQPQEVIGPEIEPLQPTEIPPEARVTPAIPSEQLTPTPALIEGLAGAPTPVPETKVSYSLPLFEKQINVDDYNQGRSILLNLGLPENYYDWRVKRGELIETRSTIMDRLGLYLANKDKIDIQKLASGEVQLPTEDMNILKEAAKQETPKALQDFLAKNNIIIKIDNLPK